MGAEALGDLARGVIFEFESCYFWPLALLIVVGVLFVFGIFCLAVRVRRLKSPPVKIVARASLATAAQTCSR